MHPAGNELTEQGDVIVGDMAIRDTAGTSVTDMMRGEQVVVVGGYQGSIGGSTISGAPAAWQLERHVEIDEIIGGYP